ncbi:MAG TPA: cohesin domain-containing protein [Candidatus Bathyarchaeia archaeon]
MQRKFVSAILFLVIVSSLVIVVHAETPLATVFINPARITVPVGKTFQVTVEISNVSKLQAFDFAVLYNTANLDCLSVEQGNFLSNINHTFSPKGEINDTYSSIFGRVWLAVAIFGEGFADGSGVLATITFNATAVGEARINLSSEFPIRSDAVKLSTCSSIPIPNIAVDGYVIIESAGQGVQNPDPDTPSLIADVNVDGEVDIEDLTLLAKSFGCAKGSSGYYGKCDLDEDGSIDIVDISLAALQFGMQA